MSFIARTQREGPYSSRNTPGQVIKSSSPTGRILHNNEDFTEKSGNISNIDARTEPLVINASGQDANILTEEDIQQIIIGYEQKYGMSSEEFLKKWAADAVPDTYETMKWMILLTSRE